MSGVAARDHAVPFQCSARVCWVPPIPPSPTAQQSEALTQETFPISFCWVGLVSGVATTSHAVPFQCSASVCPPSCPTVQQFELLTHSTPPRMLTELGFGVGTMDHVDPFQCSASVWSVVFVPFPNPVAQQSTLLTQSTPLNAFNVDALGSGVGTMDHALPFQCSANVFPLKDPRPIDPTAQQSEAVTHVTWKRLLSCEGLELALGMMDQPLVAAPAGSAIGTRLRARPAPNTSPHRRSTAESDGQCVQHCGPPPCLDTRLPLS